MQRNIIKSVSYDQEEIIRNIIKLHVPQGYIDVDSTYSKGNFYKNIKAPKYKFDIQPQTMNTIQACATNLPLKDSSVNCIMFDPPFLATTGKSLYSSANNNILSKRFGVFPTEEKLYEFYKLSLIESYRILKLNGVLIFKCQDKVSSGKQYLSHVIVINYASKIGFYPKDLFILVAKNRIISGKHKNQKHARKFHSYFLVFEKRV